MRNTNRVTSYDNVVIDTVPAGLHVQPGSFKIGSTNDAAAAIEVRDESLAIDAGVLVGDGGSITWDHSEGELGHLAEVPASVFLFYDAKIDPTTAAGVTYRNNVEVTGYTLPDTVGNETTTDRRGDRISTNRADVTATTAAINKAVRVLGEDSYVTKVSAPIGETVQYKVGVTLNAHINYYDVRVTDALPAGVDLKDATVKIHMATGDGDPVDVTGDWALSGTGQNRVWKYSKAGSGGDLLSEVTVRTLTFTYDVLLKNLGVAQNVNALQNTAGFTWAETDGGDPRTPITDKADVTVLNPALTLQKHVKYAAETDAVYTNGKTGEVNQKFTYRLNVTNANTANTGSAFNTIVVDKIPAGVVVEAGSFKMNGVAVTPTVGEQTITWTIPGPIERNGAVALTYNASFADSKTLGAAVLKNIAQITSYESFDPSVEEGRKYPAGPEVSANVTPVFPHVDPVKTVTSPVAGETYGLAYVDEPFNWTLTMTNNGTGAANTVDVVDELPVNWAYVADSAKVDGVALADPSISADGRTLTWSAAQLEAAVLAAAQAAGTDNALFPLAAKSSFVVTFDAKPLIGAIDDPGTGLPTGGAKHTNTVKVTNVTDLQKNDRNDNSTTPNYSGEDDTADAYITEADLLLEKATIGGTTAEIALSNGEKLSSGSWVAGAVAGDLIAGTVTYEQPQWQLTVTNHGPDASFGAFEIDEQQTLPAGVTVTGWKADFYAAGSQTAVSVPVDVSGAGANLKLTVGTADTSLNPAAGGNADKIVITADVHIPAGTTATAEQLKNVATVEGKTFERETNKPEDAKNPNADQAGKALTSVADLAIVKLFTGDTDNLNAGDLVNWTLTVTNNGPDHSRSTEGDNNQIVVVDDVPSEIVDPAAVTVPAGWEVKQTGNKFTFTLTPDAQLDKGASVEFTFSGRIGGDVAADTVITNEAVVTPGITPDPIDPNNEDDDSVGPITAHTSVAATKTRVLFDADTQTWVAATGDVTAGETVSYRLQLTNTGAHVPARGVTLTDTLPTYLSTAEWKAETPNTGWDLAEAGKTLTFTNPDAEIAPGATASVILTVIVAADHRGDVENSVCVTTGNLDPKQSELDDCSKDSTGFDKSVDWELIKSHVAPESGVPAVAGETVRYRLVLNNNGPSVSDGPITITDELPAGFSFADNTVVAGATLSDAAVDGQTVTWTAEGPFPVGKGIVTVEFDALVGAHVAAGTYENEARVDGPEDEPDTDPTNNDDTDEVPVIRDAQLHIDKHVRSVEGAWGETAEHPAGTTVTWRVKVTNSGSSAVPAVFTDDLTSAPGVTLVSVTGGDDWKWNDATQELEYVANGGLFPVTDAFETNAAWITIVTELAADVPPTAAPGLVNWGKITWVDNTINPDLPDGGNSARDDANITTVRAADLGLIKQVRKTAPEGEWIDADTADETGLVTAGKSTTYRVLISNDGPSDAVAPFIVIDTLPAGATFAGLVQDPTESGLAEWTAEYNADAGEVTFTRNTVFGGLAVGADPLSFAYEVAFDASIPAGTVLENIAEFDEVTTITNGDPEHESDVNPDNDSNPANVVSDRQIDLGIVKSHDAEQVRIGDELPFTIDVTNYGPSEATGIVVTDEIPAGLEVVSEVGAVLDEEGNPNGWTIELITLAEPGDDTVDPALPAQPDAGATVVASYALPLAPDASAAPLVITTLVTPVAYETVTNVAVVKGNEPEPEPDTEHPNITEDPVVVPPQVTLVVEKTTVGEFKVGKIGTYSIVVSNYGPTLDPGPITVTDELPAGLSFSSAPELPEGVLVDHTRGVVTWTLTEPLGIGEEVALTLNVNVHEAAYEQPNHEITNTVVIDSESELTPDSVVTDSITVVVVPADPLVVTGGDIAGGVLAAFALLLLGGGAVSAGVCLYVFAPRRPKI